MATDQTMVALIALYMPPATASASPAIQDIINPATVVCRVLRLRFRTEHATLAMRPAESAQKLHAIQDMLPTEPNVLNADPLSMALARPALTATARQPVRPPTAIPVTASFVKDRTTALPFSGKPAAIRKALALHIMNILCVCLFPRQPGKANAKAITATVILRTQALNARLAATEPCGFKIKKLASTALRFLWRTVLAHHA